MPKLRFRYTFLGDLIVVFLWEVYLKVSGWVSEYQSVNTLLRHLKHKKTGSEASRKIYCYVLYLLCHYTKKLPDDLVGMKKRDIESLIEDFGYHKKESGWSARTLNTLLANLKTFFKTNGFKGDKELEVEYFYAHPRARTRHEYIPTLEEALKMADCAGSLRNRAIILFLVSTGLRNSTLRAISYGDVKEELEKGEENIQIKVHSGMKKRVPSACKGNVEYVTFTSREANEALRLYLKDRQSTFAEIHDQDPLFSSECNRLPRKERNSKPLSDRQLQYLVKMAARRAGLKEWKAVTPHCLRKTHESVLRSRLTDGSRLGMKTQIYLMGHVLPGAMDTYYDKSKIGELRKEYSKLMFTPRDEKLTKALEALKSVAEFLRIRDTQLALSRRKEQEANNSGGTLKALQNFIKEAQQSRDNCNRFETNPTSTQKGNNQSQLACSQNSAEQASMLPASKRPADNNLPTRRTSARTCQGLVSTKANQPTSIKPRETKQTKLSHFLERELPDD
jgi:integrase